jgi:alpha-glucoside transport system permease protein
MEQLFSTIPVLIAVGAIGIPAVVYLALGLSERIITRFTLRRQRTIRPWLWLLVPLLLVILILVYPLVGTIFAAFQGASGESWVGFDNFTWAVTGQMRDVIFNNLVWLILFPVGTLALAVVIAVLVDRVRYEKLAMTLIVLPTAISFTAGSILWRSIYSYQAPGQPQTGLLNAIWTSATGGPPVPWLQTPMVNTLCLIFVAVWSALGVAALIISAAVKNAPAELREAAQLDGAGEWRIFRYVTWPSILPAVLVVLTTEVIFALKVFDIVYVMTNGNFNTSVIANKMFAELFLSQDLGHASAIALLLFVAALPIVIFNIRQFRAEQVQS